MLLLSCDFTTKSHVIWAFLLVDLATASMETYQNLPFKGLFRQLQAVPNRASRNAARPNIAARTRRSPALPHACGRGRGRCDGYAERQAHAPIPLWPFSFCAASIFSAFTLLAFLPQHGFSLSGANGVLAPKSMKTAFRAAIQLGCLPFILILV